MPGPMGGPGRGAGMNTEKASDFKGTTKKLINASCNASIMCLQFFLLT